MGFQEGEETGRLTKEVDEFLKAQRNMGAGLAMSLGSLMLPSTMGARKPTPPNLIQFPGKFQRVQRKFEKGFYREPKTPKPAPPSRPMDAILPALVMGNISVGSGDKKYGDSVMEFLRSQTSLNDWKERWQNNPERYAADMQLFKELFLMESFKRSPSKEGGK